MAKLVPDNIIDEILEKTDIVDIISSRITLKKAGRSYKANCPFHNEKTPSFVVSPDKQIFHCFGCGEGGNAIGFLIKYDKLNFREAIESLAEKAGVKAPLIKTEEKIARESLSGKLLGVNEAAKNFYKSNLYNKDNSFCLKYLSERGVAKETIKLFQLGFAPAAWEGLSSFFKTKGVDSELLEKVGLVLPSEKNKGYYDRFRNRLIFPIFDIGNKVIGFGGRVLNDSMPKYINSPETPLYIKGRHLYGLNFSKQFIREKNYAIIVEGYLDFIIPFQHGIKNVVATLGTALTPNHIKLLKRFTKTVVMVFDPDKAGEDASLRGLDMLIMQDMNVRIATLPKGNDPDSFVRKVGADAFESLIKSSKDLFDYKMNLLRARFNKDGVRGKAAIATLMLPTIARIPNEILKAAFLKKLSDTLSLDEAAIRLELAKIKTDYSYNASDDYECKINVSEERSSVKRSELLLLGIMLNKPEILYFLEEKLGLSEFRSHEAKDVVSLIKKHMELKEDVRPSKIINHFEDEKIKNLVAEAVSLSETIVNKEKALLDCVARLKEDNFKEDLKNLESEIRIAQDLKNSEKLDELLSRYNVLIKAHQKNIVIL